MFPNGSGSTTAGLMAGGDPGPAACELWNGTSWTEVNDFNTGKIGANSAHQGTNTSTIVFGGHPALANTEEWDGSSWTEIADLATGRKQGGSTGTASLAFLAGGTPPGSHTNVTEEWTVAVDLQTVAFD